MLRDNIQIVKENTKIFIKGLEVNSEKTKYMITSRRQNITQNPNVVIENLSFENLEKFR